MRTIFDFQRNPSHGLESFWDFLTIAISFLVLVGIIYFTGLLVLVWMELAELQKVALSKSGNLFGDQGFARALG